MRERWRPWSLARFYRYSGVLSAYGLALADVVEEAQEPCSLQYRQNSFAEIDQRVEQLAKRCCETLCARGFSRSASTGGGGGVLSESYIFIYFGVISDSYSSCVSLSLVAVK